MNKLISVLCFGICFGTAPLGAASHPQRSQYQYIQVNRFEVSDGLEFPQDYLVSMMEDIVRKLDSTGKFRQVLRQGETPAEANAPTLQLDGAVTDFRKGSRAMRYVVGFGAGKTVVRAHIRFMDAATGQVQYEKDVRGLVWVGFMGGESTGAESGLAKQVARITKQRF